MVSTESQSLLADMQSAGGQTREAERRMRHGEPDGTLLHSL